MHLFVYLVVFSKEPEHLVTFFLNGLFLDLNGRPIVAGC